MSTCRPRPVTANSVEGGNSFAPLHRDVLARPKAGQEKSDLQANHPGRDFPTDEGRRKDFRKISYEALSSVAGFSA